VKESVTIKYISGLDDTKCSNPDCRKEIREAIESLKDNLYGEGPEGSKGVYGVLKKKVSYSFLVVIAGIVLGTIAFFAGLGINHESRISKTEVVVERNTEIIKELGKETRRNQSEILTAIKELHK
jgi:hypothetical protein